MFKNLLLYILISSISVSAGLNRIKIEPAIEYKKRPKTIVYAPKKITSNLPLVILLHGHGVNGVLQNLYLGLRKEIQNKKFILALPAGTKDKAGHRFWNDQILNLGFLRGHSDDDTSTVDDFEFLNDQIDKIVKLYNVDKQQIYLIGHSNGGFFSYSYGCNGKYPIKKVIVLAGGITNNLKCQKEFDIIHIHGTKDGLVNYAGRENYFYSVNENMNYWEQYLNCQGKTVLPNKDLIFIEGKETEHIKWNNCQNGKTLELWKVNQGRHVPIFKPGFGRIMLDNLF